MRAAAGADLDQLQRRDAHRQAAALDEALLARGLEAVGDRRLAVIDDAELGRGAAHVEGQHVRAAVGGAEMGARRARRRPGPTSSSCTGVRLASSMLVRPPFDSISSSGAAMPRAASCAASRADVALGQRLDVGVDDGGGDALVLADLGRDLDRGRQA